MVCWSYPLYIIHLITDPRNGWFWPGISGWNLWYEQGQCWRWITFKICLCFEVTGWEWQTWTKPRTWPSSLGERIAWNDFRTIWGDHGPECCLDNCGYNFNDVNKILLSFSHLPFQWCKCDPNKKHKHIWSVVPFPWVQYFAPFQGPWHLWRKSSASCTYPPAARGLRCNLESWVSSGLFGVTSRNNMLISMKAMVCFIEGLGL